MKHVTLQEAEGHLSELMALVDKGEEVVITSGNRPRMKLVPIVCAHPKRFFGQYQGKIQVGEDFDAPLPESFWLGKPV